MGCTLQWSLSGGQHVCISNTEVSIPPSQRQLKKTSNGRRSQLNQFWSYKPHSNFKTTWNLLKTLYVSFKWYFWQKWKILKLVLGLNSKDRKSTRDKANISNPKVNRGCTPLTANRTSADCVQISLGRSIPYIPLGVYRTGRFNAMHQIYLPTTKTITWLIQCLRFNIVIYRLYQSNTSRLYSAIPFWELSLISKFYIRYIYIYCWLGSNWKFYGRCRIKRVTSSHTYLPLSICRMHV